MKCERIQEQLDLYAGDDLAAREAVEVEAHLRGCLVCYREYVELRRMLAEVRSTRDVAIVDGTTVVRRSVVDDVMAEIHGPPPPVPQLLPRIALVSGWAAALLLAVTLGVRTLGSSGSSPSSGPRVRSGDEPRILNPGSDVTPTAVDHAPTRRTGDAAEGPNGDEESLNRDLLKQLQELRDQGPARGPGGRPAKLVPKSLKNF
jgi:hypothetical protein